MLRQTLTLLCMAGLPAVGAAQDVKAGDSACADVRAAIAAAQDSACAKTKLECANEKALASIEAQDDEVVAQLRALGYVAADEPAFLGVFLDEAAAAGEGVTITGTVEGSAAEKAGLREGDRIVGVGDYEVTDANSLREALGNYKAGDNVRIVFTRGDERHRTKAALGSRPAEEEMGIIEVVEEEPPELPVVELAPLREVEVADEQPGYLGVSIGDAESGGVEVLSVVEGSPAAKSGVQEGDVIRAVNRTRTGTVDGLIEAVSSRKAGEQVVLTIQRGDDRVRVMATLGAREAAVETLPAGGGIVLEEIEEEGHEEGEEAEEHAEGGDETVNSRIRRLLEERRAAAQDRAQGQERRVRVERAQDDATAQLRRQVEELRAENMRLREALEARGNERRATDRRPANDLDALRAQLREMGQALRRQQQMIEELSKKINDRNDRPMARNDFVPRRAAGGVIRATDAKPSRGLFQAKDGAFAVTVAPEVDVKDGTVRIKIGDEVKELKLDGTGEHHMTFQLGDGKGHAVIMTDDGTGLKDMGIDLKALKADGANKGIRRIMLKGVDGEFKDANHNIMILNDNVGEWTENKVKVIEGAIDGTCCAATIDALINTSCCASNAKVKASASDCGECPLEAKIKASASACGECPSATKVKASTSDCGECPSATKVKASTSDCGECPASSKASVTTSECTATKVKAGIK